MKLNGLVADVTAVGSLSEQKVKLLGCFRKFWWIQAPLVAGEPLCDLNTTS